MSLFLCPVCGASLAHAGGSYRCAAGHTFDVAKAGYVHLLPVRKKHAASPGDNREMVAARTAFLDGGYYAHLAEALAEEIETNFTANDVCTFLDSGCGEGYYTQAICNHLSAKNRDVSVYGIDISKEALRRAARRLPQGKFAVASAYHLPIADNAADVLLNCFSPMCDTEFVRVLKNGAFFYYVVPAARHLWQLKEVLYANPYENETKVVTYPNLRYIKTLHTTAERHFPTQEAIEALFAMTPYAYRTPSEGRARLATLDTLTCTCAFDIHVYRCEKN